MRTLKLCRRGEPGIFSHKSNVKGGKGVERYLNCAWVYLKAQNGQGIVGDSPHGDKHPTHGALKIWLVERVQNIAFLF